MSSNFLTDFQNAKLDFQKNSNSKEKIYKNSQIEIAENIMTYENSFIQLSNITQVWRGDIPKEELPMGTLIFFGSIGIIMIGMGFAFSGFLAFLGLLLLVAVIFIGYRIQMGIKQYYGLNIELSSNRLLSFTSSEKEVITAAFNVLGNIIKDGKTHDASFINFETGSIQSSVSTTEIIKEKVMGDKITATGGSNVVGRDNKGLVNQSSNSANVFDINWDEMKKDLIDFKENNLMYHDSDVMRKTVDDALVAVENQDTGKLENTFLKAGSVAIEIFGKVTGTALGTFAAGLLK